MSFIKLASEIFCFSLNSLYIYIFFTTCTKSQTRKLRLMKRPPMQSSARSSSWKTQVKPIFSATSQNFVFNSKTLQLKAIPYLSFYLQVYHQRLQNMQKFLGINDVKVRDEKKSKLIAQLPQYISWLLVPICDKFYQTSEFARYLRGELI